MADSIHLAALSLAHTLSGVAMEYVPASGSGAFTCTAIVRAERDEVADFPRIFGMLGAEQPSWHLNFDARDVLVRPVAGDRVTSVYGITYELRTVRSDVLGTRWFCRAFIVEPDPIDVDDAFMLPIYFAGVAELGL